MQHQKFVWGALLSAVSIVALVGCGGGSGLVTPKPTATPTSVPTPMATATPRPIPNDDSPTLLYFRGDPGEFVSQGRTVLVKPPEFDFAVKGSRKSVSFFIDNSANIEFPQARFYSVEFAAPAGEELHVGTYNNAIRFPFNGDNPGIDISGEGRGNNAQTGSFTVRQIVFNANNQLQNFDADFEQFSESSNKKLTGTIRYNSTLR